MAWVVSYPLSLRHIEEMMQERGVFVDHATVHRWAIKILPVLSAVFRQAPGCAERKSRKRLPCAPYLASLAAMREAQADGALFEPKGSCDWVESKLAEWKRAIERTLNWVHG